MNLANADLLFELLTEELPPRTLLSLSNALTQGIVSGLDKACVAHGKSRSFATPRRLAVWVRACALRAPDRNAERRGPPVSASFDANGAPMQAAIAFAKSCHVAVGELERLDTDKGAWLVYRAVESGATTLSLLGDIIKQAIAALPIAKRMRWGSNAAEFVRPVRGVVLLFGAEVVPLEILGIQAGRVTAGHRFHTKRAVTIHSAKSYEAQLARAKVVADFAKRRERIRAGVLSFGAGVGKTLVDDQLLDEVTALVEWPVPVAGQFEERFLALPREVVVATVQGHQRYFPVERSDGKLSNWFVTVSNIESRDPIKVREGNERVVRPRLSDAAFFKDQDLKINLEAHAAKLTGVIFQTKLGNYAEKTRRVKILAETIGARISAGPEVSRAAELAKADLMTAMVGEFPELQGTMGRYYALVQGESAAVALAIEEHYRPRFAGDALPASRIGQALALADKIDTLVGIFAIDLKPTGTKDPFGLRRAALGMLRILLEGKLNLDVYELIGISAMAQPVQKTQVAEEVYDFLAERFRGLLLERNDGSTTEMIDAVLTGRPHSPLEVDARLQALKEFLQHPDASVLTGLNKRIANILKKAQIGNEVRVDTTSLIEPAEIRLHQVLAQISSQVLEAAAAGHYSLSLMRLMGLRASVDDFFEHVMVMDEHLVRRNNRLALLRDVQLLLGCVADLARLPG